MELPEGAVEDDSQLAEGDEGEVVGVLAGRERDVPVRVVDIAGTTVAQGRPGTERRVMMEPRERDEIRTIYLAGGRPTRA